jgi:arylsulfatase A-like enzyme
MYLHYMEPHNPYDPPQVFVDRVLDGRAQPDRDEVNERMVLPSMGRFSDEMVQAVKDFYDAEVMSVDAALRSLFEALAARHFLDNAIVVVLADHGEEFREHGLMGHHQTLYEEVVRVPLIMRVPGHNGAVRVDPIVSVSDIAPTVLDLAGIPAPETFEAASLRRAMGLQRRSWWPFGGSDDPPSSPLPATGVAFSELIKEGTMRQRPHERAVITATDKLIVDVDGGREFYDLRADPGETNPNALDGDARTRLSTEIADFVTQTAGRTVPAATSAMDAETRERMRALGYQE